MNENLKNVAVDPMFVIQHQVIKFGLGCIAGLIVNKVYNKNVVIPQLQKIYDKQNQK